MITKPQNLTVVILAYRKNRLNHRLLFGDPVMWVRRGWRRSMVAFEAGQLFAYERWIGNQFGTQDWRIFICKSGIIGQTLTRLPGILPGAILLASTNGKTGSQRLSCLIRNVEKHPDLNLTDISEDRWRAIGNAIAIGQMPEIGKTVYV